MMLYILWHLIYRFNRILILFLNYIITNGSRNLSIFLNRRTDLLLLAFDCKFLAKIDIFEWNTL